MTRDSVEVSLSMFIISGRFWCDKDTYPLGLPRAGQLTAVKYIPDI